MSLILSSCSGCCPVCGCGDFCLAGNGDDDYYPASIDQIVDRLNRNAYPNYVERMVSELRSRGVEYNMEKLGSLAVSPELRESISAPTDKEVKAMITEVFGN